MTVEAFMRDSKPVAPCAHIASCRLYPLFGMKASLKIWQAMYCETDHVNCERFQRSRRGEAVEDTLLPNGKVLGAK
jgi:hypothetical protein